MLRQITVISILFLIFLNQTFSFHADLTARCPQNQTFLRYGEDCDNCIMYRNNINFRCYLRNVQKCYCKQKYIRISDFNQTCVLRQDCPQVCGENEIGVESLDACQPSCCNMNRRPCPVVPHRSGCHCKDGYIREVKHIGKCIPINQCSQSKKCKDKNEIYTRLCGCERVTTCQYRPKYCLKICRTGCYCRRGFLKNEITDRCVRKERCPKN